MTGSTMLRLGAAIVITTLCAGCMRGSATQGDASVAARDILPALAGEWTGVLEYADYRTDERVQLPTRMTATLAGGALQIAYAYREPSGTIVNANSVHRALDDGRRYVMGTDTLTVLSMEGFGSARSGATEARAVLLGTSTENDIIVPARHHITLRGDSLIIRKETRDPPRLRNEYRFRRGGT